MSYWVCLCVCVFMVAVVTRQLKNKNDQIYLGCHFPNVEVAVGKYRVMNVMLYFGGLMRYLTGTC